MQTKLITMEVSLQAPSDQLRTAIKGANTLRSDALKTTIETQLSTQGAPLRWAITSVDQVRQIAHVEAVLTTL